MSQRARVTFRNRHGTLIKKSVPSNEAEQMSTQYFPCAECSYLSPNDKILMCDGTAIDGENCDKCVCFTCANVTYLPEGDWFCKECH